MPITYSAEARFSLGQGWEVAVLIHVDEQAFETQLTPANTIGELIDEVRAGLGGGKRLVVGIHADGLDIAGEGYAKTLDKPLASYGRYDFVTSDPQRVVRDALTECAPVLADAAARRAEAVDLLTKGDNGAGIAALGECCRAWQQVHEAICNAIGLLGLDPGALGLPEGPLSAVLGGTRDQLAQVHEALQAQDFVLLSDILQYEFEPIIENWRAAIDAILETTEAAAQRT